MNIHQFHPKLYWALKVFKKRWRHLEEGGLLGLPFPYLGTSTPPVPVAQKALLPDVSMTCSHTSSKLLLRENEHCSDHICEAVVLSWAVTPPRTSLEVEDAFSDLYKSDLWAGGDLRPFLVYFSLWCVLSTDKLSMGWPKSPPSFFLWNKRCFFHIHR